MPENLLTDANAEITKVGEEQEVKTPEVKEEEPDAGAGDADTKEKDGKADDSKNEGAPEEYEAFTLPEGVTADETVLTDFKSLAKELKLSQKDAQRVVDLQTSLATRAAENMQKQWEGVVTDWREKATSDKEYGGKALEANLGIAKKALDKFATDEFRKAIDETSFGNHPELVRLLYRVGKAMGEDGVLNGGTGNSGPRDPAKILFPDMN